MADERREPHRSVVISYNPHVESAADLASSLHDAVVSRGLKAWVTDGSDLNATRVLYEGSDLIICLGGDGTVLRCARLAMGLPALILSVNMGRLGFLTEVDADEICGHLDDVLGGKGRIEERTMLDASVPGRGVTFHALNEVVVGRAQLSRAIQLAVDVDSVRIGDYRCDAVLIASATGSTAYALSVGGPILHPESRDIVVMPVAPHLAARHALVLPPREVVHVTLEPDQLAVLSVDGESDLELDEGESVLVQASQYRARFLRLHPRTDFYKRMADQLGWHRPGGNSKPLPLRPA